MLLMNGVVGAVKEVDKLPNTGHHIVAEVLDMHCVRVAIVEPAP